MLPATDNPTSERLINKILKKVECLNFVQKKGSCLDNKMDDLKFKRIEGIHVDRSLYFPNVEVNIIYASLSELTK